MSPQSVSFTVPGTPVPQGSKAAFVVKGRAVIADDNRAQLKPYRATVAAHAFAAMYDREQLAGPLLLALEFVMPRPKSHFRTGRYAGQLREAAPRYVGTRPDIDKLARSIADALSGVVFRDDAQVASLQASKVYGAHPMTVVQVIELNGAADA